ncbi:hypothetical protein [Pseudomonas sp. GM41(2012)]|uniref:hypothetical protein n=1 Tax=Pseudomonas sp. (strain GM41(2012)) TaxID=1144708 RepID=UPI0013634696|nr:hypothetical protein [Pseudomonas sp. GM41(2012)]
MDAEGIISRLPTRITMLGNQVAGITSEHEVFDRALTTFTDLDHFRDVTKMIGRLYSSGYGAP